MTTVQDKAGSAGSEQSTAEQAKQKVQETAQQVQGQVGEKAREVKSDAGHRLRNEINTRSTQTGEQVSSTAGAIRRVGGELRSEGQDRPAQLADQAAERAERLGRYLQDADAERILRDVESFARRRPWLIAIGGAALGFLASRFVKASSTQSESPVANRSSRAVGAGAPALPSGDPVAGSGETYVAEAAAPTPTQPTTRGSSGGRADR